MNKLAISMAVLSLTSVGAFANLLSNGGFESNDYGGTNYKIYNNGDTGISNWSVDLMSVDIVGTNYAPHSGNFALDLVGSPGPGGVYQYFTQSTGTRYHVSFWGRYTGDISNSAVGAVAYQDGGGNFNLTTDWAEYSFDYVAGSGIGGFEIYSLTGGYGNTFVDDISIEAVPEPATMAVLGLGLLAVARRRRK